MLRFHLPPNLVAAAARNAIPVRVEIDLATAPTPNLLPALALLQRWCGPKPPAFLQLTRAQLRDLATVVGTEPVFCENGRAAPWCHDDLVAEPVPVAPVSATGHRPAAKPARSAEPAMTIDGSEHFLALTLPSREHPRYGDALALVREHGFVLEPSNRKWWLRDRHKTLNFLAAHLTRLRDVFDFPQPAQFTSKRSETTVPTQSLYLLNADLIRERGEDLAKPLIAIKEDDAARLARLWLRVLNRPITDAEREDALAFLQTSKAAGETKAWTELARALFGTNEFLLRF